MSLPTQPGTSQANVSIPPPDVPSSLLTPALTPRTPRARSSPSSPLREPTSSVPAPFKIPPSRVMYAKGFALLVRKL